MVDIKPSELGAGKLYLESGGGWVKFGKSEGTGTITYMAEYWDGTSAEGGSTLESKINIGQNATIEMTLIEYSKENIQRAAPLATVYTDGADMALGFGGGINLDVFDSAFKLRFHPMNTLAAGGTDDESYTKDDMIFWKAASTTDLALAFAYDDRRKVPVTFDIFRDTTLDEAYSLFIIGDPATVGMAQTPPALLDTIPANGATAVAVGAKVYVVLDQQLVDDKIGAGDVGLCLESTGDAVTCTKTYGKTISQMFNADVTVNNPSAVASTTEFTLATAEIMALDDILNTQVIKIVEGDCSHITTISDYTSLGVVTLSEACPFTFTTAATYEIYGGFIELDPSVDLSAATSYQIVVGGVQGRNLLQKAEPESRKFTTA